MDEQVILTFDDSDSEFPEFERVSLTPYISKTIQGGKVTSIVLDGDFTKEELENILRFFDE